MPCNKSKLVYDDEEDWWNQQYEWYLSDEDINDLAAIQTWANSGALLYEALANRNIGGLAKIALPSGVGVALAIVILAYWGWIQWSNSGCGVIVNFYLLPTGHTAVYIESQ